MSHTLLSIRIPKLVLIRRNNFFNDNGGFNTDPLRWSGLTTRCKVQELSSYLIFLIYQGAGLKIHGEKMNFSLLSKPELTAKYIGADYVEHELFFLL